MNLLNILNISKLSGYQRNSAEFNKKKYDAMCDVSDVYDGYKYYSDFLLEKLIKIFKYNNLPDTIPADALEDIILNDGKAGFVKSKYGFVAVPVNKYGVGLYRKYEPFAVYTTPLVKGRGVVGKDIIIIKNNSYELDCRRIIKRYARQLADVEASINICLSNMRQNAITSCMNEESAESYKAVQIANRLGQTDVVLDKSFLNALQTMPLPKNNSGADINQLLTAREEILRMFFAEIGVNTVNNKRERLTTDEVNSNNQLLLFNIRDMLENRQKAVEEVNNKFGLNITVELADEYKLITNNEKGGLK